MTDLSSRVDEISTIISSYVRPQLRAHGGDIVLLRVDGTQVFVKVSGDCSRDASGTAKGPYTNRFR